LLVMNKTRMHNNAGIIPSNMILGGKEPVLLLYTPFRGNTAWIISQVIRQVMTSAVFFPVAFRIAQMNNKSVASVVQAKMMLM
jgi:hypothetical protein